MRQTLRSLVRPLAIISAIVVAVVVVFISILAVYEYWYQSWSISTNSEMISDGTCNIAVIPVVNEITSFDGGSLEDFDFENAGVTSADRVVARIRAASADPDIQGIMLRVDSTGGGGVASEVIANELKSLSKPNAALIREVGTSGGYLISTGADTIIASALSDVGGIGVNMSYLDNSRQNTRNGIDYVQLTSVKYKDYGSPDRPMTSDERALKERDLAIYQKAFVEEVAANRNLPIEKIEKLADGSSMPGALALSNGLIDAMGNEQTAREWFAEKIGASNDSIVFCK